MWLATLQREREREKGIEAALRTRVLCFCVRFPLFSHCPRQRQRRPSLVAPRQMYLQNTKRKNLLNQRCCGNQLRANLTKPPKKRAHTHRGMVLRAGDEGGQPQAGVARATPGTALGVSK